VWHCVRRLVLTHAATFRVLCCVVPSAKPRSGRTSFLTRFLHSRLAHPLVASLHFPFFSLYLLSPSLRLPRLFDFPRSAPFLYSDFPTNPHSTCATTAATTAHSTPTSPRILTLHVLLLPLQGRSYLE
jgi:hypothetical protein